MTDIDAELRTLISSKQWPAVVERVRSHPHEVVGGSSPGSSSPPPRDGRGYTVLHAVAAYHRDTDGRELVPAIRAILHAADAIDYDAAAFGVGGAGAGRGGGAMGPVVRGDCSRTRATALRGRRCTWFASRAASPGARSPR